MCDNTPMIDPRYNELESPTGLLTISEAAERLRISPYTLARHIRAGRLPAVRVGGTVRLEARAVDRFQVPYEIRGGGA